MAKRDGLSPGGAAMMKVIAGTADAFFGLRAAGEKIGAVNKWGGGTWRFLDSLATDGPQTVPNLARARSVSRQRIQKLADELAADGLLEFTDNPAHRRSKLVRLTPAGTAEHARLTARIQGWAEELALDMKPKDLKRAAKVLNTLAGRLADVAD